MVSLENIPVNSGSAECPASERGSLAEPSHGARPNDIPATAIQILSRARCAVDQDHALATALIGRVINLLRTTANDDPFGTSGGAVGGRLAPWQMRNVTSHIDANLHRALTAAELADIANLSRSYFSRAFKKSFGTAPHAYIMSRRSLRAREMMLTTEDPLGQIALACGIVGQSQFCKMFRRTVGSNPLAWRRMFKTQTHPLTEIAPQSHVISSTPTHRVT
jgi:AraC family transcriptional regulator